MKKQISQRPRSQQIPKSLKFNKGIPQRPAASNIRPEYKTCKKSNWRKLQICPKTKKTKFAVKIQIFLIFKGNRTRQKRKELLEC